MYKKEGNKSADNVGEQLIPRENLFHVFHFDMRLELNITMRYFSCLSVSWRLVICCVKNKSTDKRHAAHTFRAETSSAKVTMLLPTTILYLDNYIREITLLVGGFPNTTTTIILRSQTKTRKVVTKFLSQSLIESIWWWRDEHYTHTLEVYIYILYILLWNAHSCTCVCVEEATGCVPSERVPVHHTISPQKHKMIRKFSFFQKETATCF